MSVAYANLGQFLSFACGVLVEFRCSFEFSGKEIPFVNRILADIKPWRNGRAMISDFVSAHEIKGQFALADKFCNNW